MRRAVRAFLLGAAVSALVSAPVLGKAGGDPSVPLTTGQEVLQVTGGASGSFEYTIDGTELCYTLSYKGLTGPATGAHIHLGVRGVAGGVVVPLAWEAATEATITTCTTVDAGVLAAIAANPDSYYVNVHTAANPAGEVRGQLK